jgi:flagellin
MSMLRSARAQPAPAGTLSVAFNEAGTSKLTLTGAQLTSSGLAIAASTNNFQTNSDINAALTNLSKALTTLQTQSALFGSNESIVSARTEFTKSLVQTLQTGAHNLLASDTNEDGAALLALQTRQQIATTSLSLVQGADAEVLRLFGL